MRTLFISLAASAVITVAVVSGSITPAMATAAQLPAHKAFDAGQKDPAQGCLTTRLLSHAAYRPTSSGAIRCSHPLSTDTLMTVHRWDRT